MRKLAGCGFLVFVACNSLCPEFTWAQASTNRAQTAAEAAAGILPANSNYPQGDVRRYGAALDGIQDDTGAIVNWLKVGGQLTAPVIGTALVSAPLLLVSNTTLRAVDGFTIKQKNNAAISGGILTGNSVKNVLIEGLTIDANAQNNSNVLTYGIVLENGAGNTIRRVHVVDTTQACIELAEEQGSKVLESWLLRCGRNIGTDNHGLMVVSITSTPVSDILVSRNFVDSAYRKGIAVYSAAPGKVASITISSNTVLNCGLGGIYLANAPLASAQKNIIVSDNDLLRNYVAVQVSNVEGGTVMGNRAEGGSGQGIYLSDVVGVAVTGNSVVGVGSDGILVTSSVITSTGITVAANSVINPNQAGSASGAGIHLNTVTQSRVDANTVVGESSAPKQIYGILEDGAAKNNVFTANQVANAAVQLTQTIDPVTP